MGLFGKFLRKKEKEVTPGGSDVYRYSELPNRGFRAPESMGTYAREVTERFESVFPGRESFVYHEMVSDLVHIDVNIMRPTQEQPFYVLYTTGMSDLPMTLPDEVEHKEKYQYAELFQFLPASWNLGKEFDIDKDLSRASYWPIGMMKFLARFPHQYQTWLGWGHTIPNGPDYAPLDDTVGFGGIVLSGGGDGPLGALKAKDGKELHFYHVIPAYKEEIEYKLKYGMEALDALFREKELPVVLDIRRPNLCADFHEVLDAE